MPYNHPSGVKCMNITQFWHQEAKSENRDVSEVMEDYYSSVAKDEENSRQEILNDKVGALVKLQEYYHPDYLDDVKFNPTEVMEITDAKVSISIKYCRTSFTAKVMCDDGKTRNLEYSEAVYNGSYMDPPDFESNCVEITDV